VDACPSLALQAGVFAPGELVSPERWFGNQKGRKEKLPLPAGLSRRGDIWADAAPRKHRSARTSRVVAGMDAFFHVLVSKHRSGGASPPVAAEMGVPLPLGVLRHGC